MALSQRTQCTPLGCRSSTRQPRLVARLGAGGSSTRSTLSRRSGAVNVTNSLYGARYVRSRRHSTLPIHLEYVLLPHPSAFMHARLRSNASACNRYKYSYMMFQHAAGVRAGCQTGVVPLLTRMVGHNCSRARLGALSGQAPSQQGPISQHRFLCVVGVSLSLQPW